METAETPKKTARDKVIVAAQKLMTGQGYSATTVDTIVREAGVAKGSFYHAFESKQDLALAALEDFAIQAWSVVSSGPYRQESDAVRRALAFVDFLEESAESLWAQGSLLGSLAVEVADKHPELRQRISNLFSRYEDKFVRLFAPALEVRGVQQPAARELAVHLLAVIEGSAITARSHGEARYLRAGLAHFGRYLRLLLGEPSRA